jgi:uncharacterized coiled-coil protein SlyX
MPRVTIEALQAQIAERDTEIARLNDLVAELRGQRAATAAALRLMHSLVDDALSRG